MSTPAPDVNACAGVPKQPVPVYGLDLTYDTIHTSRGRTSSTPATRGDSNGVVQKKVTYDFAYAYNPQRCLSTAARAEPHRGATYTYDLDGNQAGWTHDQNGTRRTIVWTTRTASRVLPTTAAPRPTSTTTRASA